MARASSLTTLKKEIRNLRARVRLLERAAPPEREQSKDEYFGVAQSKAEFDARHEAVMEYYRQKRIERYRANPEWPEGDVAAERELHEYLKGHGFQPGPSTIPKEARALLKSRKRKAGD